MIEKYDRYSLMKKEYEYLKKARKIIDVPEPIAINKDFKYVLVPSTYLESPFSGILSTGRSWMKS